MRSRRTRRFALTLGSTVLALGVGLAGAPAALADDSTTIPIAYDIKGTTHIGAGVNANVALGPSTLNTNLDLDSGAFSGGVLAFPASSVTFKALGFIPLRGTVNLIQSGAITGSLVSADTNIVTATAKYTIKLTNLQVQFLGKWLPLSVGDKCQTITPATLNLKTPAGQSFDITDGGPITGKYTIGKFQNCAPLKLPDLFGVGSLAVNSLVPGSNNTATLTLANGRILE